MASSAKTVSESQALIHYREPPTPEAFLRSETERITNEAFRRSMEIMKYGKDRLTSLVPDPQTVCFTPSRELYHVLHPLKGPYSIENANMIIERPKCSAGDSEIEIDIYLPTGLKPEQMGNMPILMFSHGLGVNPAEYRSFLENLTSHGYIVLNVNHPSSSGFAPFSAEICDVDAIDCMPKDEQEKEIGNLAARQVDNIRFIIDQIRNKGIFQDLDLSDQIILAGHSLGGAASVIVSREDDQIRGCVNLDGKLIGAEATRADGLRIPVLTVLSDKHIDPEIIPMKWREEYFKINDEMLREMDELDRHSDSSTLVEIPDIDHMDFCFSNFKTWLLRLGSLEGPIKAYRITSQKLMDFMQSIFNKK